MKKLLAISLLMFSSMAFAETVTPDLLVGKWQCKGEGTGENVKVHGVSYDINYPDGSYESEATLYLDYPTFPNATAIVKAKSQGQWRIQGNEMDSWRTRVTKFEINATNPVIQSILEKRDIPHTSLYKVAVSNITVLSKDNLLFEMNKEYAQISKGAGKQSCTRIK